MLGYGISFASFGIVECMTSTKYHIKSIGYLAASQSFDKETEVAVLVVNLVKKVHTKRPTHAMLTLASVADSSLMFRTCSLHLLVRCSAVSLRR